MKRLLKMLLYIKQTIIGKAEQLIGPGARDTSLVLHVRPTKGQASRCPVCGKRMQYYDEGLGARCWRALGLGVVRVYLKGWAPRARCTGHGAHMASVPWVRHGSWFTYDFEQWATWISLHASRKVAAEPCRVDWVTVGPVISRVEADERAKGPSPFDGLVFLGNYR